MALQLEDICHLRVRPCSARLSRSRVSRSEAVHEGGLVVLCEGETSQGPGVAS